LFGILKDPSTHNVMLVTSDGGSVSGHKAILAASSPVLCAMFSDNVHTSGKMEILLPLVDAETFFSLVSHQQSDLEGHGSSQNIYRHEVDFTATLPV